MDIEYVDAPEPPPLDNRFIYVEKKTERYKDVYEPITLKPLQKARPIAYDPNRYKNM